MKYQAVILAITVLFLAIILVSSRTTLAQVNDQLTTIDKVNEEINQAYTNVLAAEKAGGNVTQLLEKLNIAGDFLAKAENAYKSVDTANVALNLEKGSEIAYQVNVDALNLRSDSLIESQNSIQLTLIFSIVGAIVFGISLFLIWRRFKHAHVMKVLGMKPEVVENET